MGLFKVLSENFKTQHNEMILLLQYCELIREQSKSPKEWTDCIRIKASDYKYKEKDKRLKEWLIIGIDNDEVMKKII